MSENEIVQVLLLGNKRFSKDMNFRIVRSFIFEYTNFSQFVSLKIVKDLMNHFLLDRNLFDIFSRRA